MKLTWEEKEIIINSLKAHLSILAPIGVNDRIKKLIDKVKKL